MTITRTLTLASLALAGLGLAAPAAGAGQETAIAGTVTDETGGVLPGVTVEARGPAAGGPPRIAVTDGAGRFSFTALEPGAYDLTLILPGFVTVVRAGVEPGAEVEIELQAQFEETVVVVGTRAAPRSATASPVPIDAIPYQDIVSQGATDLSDQLRNVVPSYNVNAQPISDAATDRAAGEPARSGPRPHPGAGQRQAPAPLGGHQLARQRGGGRRPGAGRLRHPGDRAAASRSAAGRGVGAVRVGRESPACSTSS